LKHSKISFIAATLLAMPALAAPKVGEKAPEFKFVECGTKAWCLPKKGEDLSKAKMHDLSELKGKLVVLEWYNKDCPFVRKHYDAKNMQGLQKTYTGKGVTWLSVVSSAPGKQGYLAANDVSGQITKEDSAPTAVILDPEGKLGKEYGAKTTPHMYIIGKDGKLVYQGGIDDKPSTEKEDIAKAKPLVKAALDQAIDGKPVAVATSEPYGCSVKYQ
jgi:peroxiredoxin